MKIMSRPESVLNILLLTASVVVIALGGQAFYSRMRVPSQASYEAGQILPLKVNTESVQRTLVVVMDSRCRFCEASIPFYQKLLDNEGHREGVYRVVAVGLDEPSTFRRYLSEHNLRFDDVLTSGFAESGIRATPTLLLIDSARRIQRVWVGQQTKTGETTVLKALM